MLGFKKQSNFDHKNNTICLLSAVKGGERSILGKEFHISFTIMIEIKVPSCRSYLVVNYDFLINRGPRSVI